MKRDEVLTLVREHLAEELEVDIEKIDEGTRFKEDLDADSLDLYELVMELEDRYGVTRLRGAGDADRDRRRRGRLRGRARAGLSRWRRTPSSPVAALSALIDELPEELRRQALTHSSWTERRVDSFERLAFLGDSVLGLSVATEVFERFAEGRRRRPDQDPQPGGQRRLLRRGRPPARGAGDAARRTSPRSVTGGDPGRGPARRRAAAAGGDRGADRRLLPRLRLRAHRGGGGGRLRAADRARLRDPDRLQVRPAGAAGAARGARKLRGDRGHRPTAPAHLRGGGDRRFRAGRDGARGAARRRPSRSPPSRPGAAWRLSRSRRRVRLDREP